MAPLHTAPAGSGVMPTDPAEVPADAPARRWIPRRVQVTRSAAELPHTAEILRRCELAGVGDIELLASDRLRFPRPDPADDPARSGYAWAKSTLAVVVAPPSALKPQPIPPSADWRIDLARGCPAHCQYCYLAGSLSGPPVTRVYANLDEVLAGVHTHAGQGTVTSRTAERGHEGTTFEMSCYTDPLGIEGVTGSLAAAITRVGTGRFGPGGEQPVQLRFTTKFDDVSELLDLPHAGRTRARFSVNSDEVAGRFEGGTARMPARLAAMRALAAAGYPVGLTIAPIMPLGDWRAGYGRLLAAVAGALAGLPDLDLTVEIITHRFTPASRDTLLSWYPQTRLEMDTGSRSAKRSKFGGVKYVYPREVMAEMRSWFTAELDHRLPNARLLYWT